MLQCEIEKSECSFITEETDMNELAEIIRNTRSIYSFEHKDSYASIASIENNKENYSHLTISIYNHPDMKGVAVLKYALYKKGKKLASEEFSSPELIYWAIKNFPEIFEQIQMENENHFYEKEK